jgi:hypothetical protein
MILKQSAASLGSGSSRLVRFLHPRTLFILHFSFLIPITKCRIVAAAGLALHPLLCTVMLQTSLWQGICQQRFNAIPKDSFGMTDGKA